MSGPQPKGVFYLDTYTPINNLLLEMVSRRMNHTRFQLGPGHVHVTILHTEEQSVKLLEFVEKLVAGRV